MGTMKTMKTSLLLAACVVAATLDPARADTFRFFNLEGRKPYYVEAEIRADEQVAAENATLAERQKAWDEADPKTRSKWRPAPARRVVKVETNDVPL